MSRQLQERDHDDNPHGDRSNEIIEKAYRRGAQQSLAMALRVKLPVGMSTRTFLEVVADVVGCQRFSRDAFPSFMHQALYKACQRLDIWDDEFRPHEEKS